VRWTLRLQILVPFVLLSLGAIVVTTVITVATAIRQIERERDEQLAAEVQTLALANFPLHEAVLQRLKILTGADVVVLQQGQLQGTTLTGFSAQSVVQLASPEILWQGQLYRIARAQQLPPVGDRELLLLRPRRSGWTTQSQLLETVTGLCVAAAVVVLLISAAFSQSVVHRLKRIQHQLSEMASHRYAAQPLIGPVDELQELQATANQLAERMERFEREIAQTERLRLLAQLTGGLVHTLRNSITGAKLAVQLHQRRCPLGDQEESLAVARQQLELTQEQVTAMLSLGTPQARPAEPGDLRKILADMTQLLDAVCKHHRVGFQVAVELNEPESQVQDQTRIKGAILNLALNAIEAAGPGGRIAVRAQRQGDLIVLEVIDSGTGPPEVLGESIAEPFVTTKAAGVGLGLMLARQAAESEGGTLTWKRADGLTVFCMSWPAKVERRSAS
jgi:signal transduction histidine kinase